MKTKKPRTVSVFLLHKIQSRRVGFSPAGLETFEFLDKEGLQNLGALVEGRVAGVVVSTVVEDFGHVGYKLRQLDILALL